jgi:hypothetical protein
LFLHLLSVLGGFLADSNNLQGELPDEVGALSFLEVLDLFENSIWGAVPTVLGSLPDLRELDVEENVLTGPAFVDLSSAVAIESYRVSFNQLTGTVPELGARTTLKEVWAAGNRLVGTIPSSLGILPNLGASRLRALILRSILLDRALSAGCSRTRFRLVTL